MFRRYVHKEDETMAIITMSRQLGSSGMEIAEALATHLNADRVDKDSLEQTLVSHGISEAKMERFDEKKPSFWDSFSSDKDRYLHFLKTAILEVARNGNAVILGRGAQVILSEVPGILHVRCIAPMESRIARVSARFGCDEHQARKLIQQSDNDRAGFYRYFFDVRWESPENYDLSINTATMEAGAVIGLIENAVTLKQSQTDSATTAAAISDLCLSQTIASAILFDENIPVRFLGVFAKDGVVTLAGSVNTAGLVHRAEDVAKRVSGVKSVVNEIQVLPEYTGTIM